LPVEQLFTGLDERLHACLWTPSVDTTGSPRVVGVLVAVHGLGDHTGRFANVAESLCEIGWATLAFDLPGHGKSPGTAGKIDSFDSILNDIAAARATASAAFPDVPQVLLGHSMGGNFATNYVLRIRDSAHEGTPLAGLVLCAPMLLPPRPMPRPFIFAAWLTGYLVPWVQFRRDVDAATLTGDEDEVRAIAADPLMHSQISMYLATQLVSQGRWAIDHAREIDLPTLIMYGEADQLIDRAACDHFAIRIGESATLVTWPHTRHALFHDRDRIFVIQRLKQWLGRIT
jgi:alpha-beta hydrolase superfamily lysophospholipase